MSKKNYCKRKISAVNIEDEFEASEDERVDANALSDVSDADPETADEQSDTESDDGTRYSVCYIAKNGLEWSTAVPDTGKTRAADKMSVAPGVRPHVRDMVKTPVDAFNTFFTREMKIALVIHTNEKMVEISPESTPLDIVELDAFLGLLILHGVYHESQKPISQLWNQTMGRPLYNATMSRDRFLQIFGALRFDDKLSRPLRVASDKLALVRELFELWLPSLKNSYVPGPYVTVDEQLYPFRGRCRFKQYIPSKPSKYGLKFFILADAASNYCCNIQPYTGKAKGEPPERNQGRRVVLDLVEYLGVDSGRNVTTDNFFTDFELANELLRRKMTLVGTVRKNKSEIPPAFLPCKDREVFSSLFGFTKDHTLVSYVPKKSKAVILLSTHHHDYETQDTTERKPVIITTYNETKAGVDTLDQLVAYYSVKRKSCRWNVVFVFDMIDLSACNALVVYNELFPEENLTKYRRRVFLDNLGKGLLTAHLRRRLDDRRVALSSKQVIRVLLKDGEVGRPSVLDKAEQQIPEKRRCQVCGRGKDRKTYNVCKLCRIPVCGEHSCLLCVACFEAAHENG